MHLHARNKGHIRQVFHPPKRKPFQAQLPVFQEAFARVFAFEDLKPELE
jgi:hypothetical protein